MKLLITILVTFLAGMGAGLGTGFAGMSAAAVISPILITFLGIDPYMAVGIALSSDVLASAVSAYTYGKNKNLDVKNGLIMMVTVLLFTVVGSYISSLVPSHTMGSFSVFMTFLLGIKFIVKPVMTTKEAMGQVSAKKRALQSVICGVMIGYICSALTDFLVTFADDSNIVNLHNWSLGSFSGMSWDNVRTMAVVCGAALILTFLLSKPLRAYQLGEVYAQNLGVPLRAFRAALILLSSVLSACVTAFAGPISFVGIAVPHLMKSLFKSAEPLLMIPACFLGGGAFCLFCDLIARTAFAPTEVSISSVTAVFGAPVVIYMMLHRKGAQ